MGTELINRQEFLQGESIKSIYFGGGTPSVLSIEHLDHLLSIIRDCYNAPVVQELTLEANPEDLSIDYCKQLRDIGINRLSVGIQSFYDDDLIPMNRIHTASQSYAALDNVISAGFEKVTIDLIYGLACADDKRFKDNLRIFEQFDIGHLSAYALTVEEKTALAYQIKSGKQRPIDDGKSLSDFAYLQSWARENGFDHYEISNLAGPGQKAIHNHSYWTGEKYLGIGPAAHSFDGSHRYWNISNNAGYIKGITEGDETLTSEALSKADLYNEMVMTGLRLAKGLDLITVKNLGDDYYEFLLSEARTKLDAGILVMEEKGLRLVEDQRFFADGHASDLFWV